jgi:hypothetical protein
MATYSKIAFQPAGTTGTGLGIPVTATSIASPTTIHTAASVAATIDEVWIYAQNYDTVARKVSVLFGGVSAGDNEIEITIQPESGLTLVVPGLILMGNASAKVVKAYAATGTSIVLYGYVTRVA